MGLFEGFFERFAEGAEAGWNGLQEVIFCDNKDGEENNLKKGMNVVHDTLNGNNED